LPFKTLQTLIQIRRYVETQALAGRAFLLSLFAGAISSPGSPGAYEFNGRVYHCDKVISRDISIVGGGAAGTYAAVRLQDLGKTVLLIEKIDRLGGNTQTYHDPVSKKTIDYGVRVWHELPEVFN
jgi:NADPH-dependent 2,4-dienoyl-CoA reductase/sulfur reductase-like enzyme